MSVYRTIGPLVSSPEPKAHKVSLCIPVDPASVGASVRKHFQTRISPQPVGQS